jgi:hypothetical protein
MLSFIMQNAIMQTVIYAECHQKPSLLNVIYGECRYAECHRKALYAECHLW